MKKENQKAIECLKEIKYFINPKNNELSIITRNNFVNYIDTKIKELEEEK